jgi:ubiquinone/menaquinone biosynthesis C-methylase UbiE
MVAQLSWPTSARAEELIEVGLGIEQHGCMRSRPKLVIAIAATLTVVQAGPSAGQPNPDTNQPAIECPLAKQGIHPADLRPFKDVEKYIAFLERPDRAKWQRPDAVVAALGLAGNETVVDVGAGSGYFSFRLAAVLPSGSVVAIDIQPEMVRHMHHKAMSEKVQNLRAVLGQSDDPGIPPGADWVLLCDVLHHVPGQQAWLRKLAGGMKAGARLALIEFKEGKLPQGPPEHRKIPRAKLLKLATKAGLVLDKDNSKLLPYQTFLILRKP